MRAETSLVGLSEVFLKLTPLKMGDEFLFFKEKNHVLFFINPSGDILRDVNIVPEKIQNKKRFKVVNTSLDLRYAPLPKKDRIFYSPHH